MVSILDTPMVSDASAEHIGARNSRGDIERDLVASLPVFCLCVKDLFSSLNSHDRFDQAPLVESLMVV